MGWALDAFWSSFPFKPNVPHQTHTGTRKQKEETFMRNYEEIPEPGDLVRICSDRHILGHTEKAIMVKIGQTLYGEPITAFYPKSLCQIRANSTGGYDVYVPRWTNHRKQCQVGDFEGHNTPGFTDLPF